MNPGTPHCLEVEESAKETRPRAGVASEEDQNTPPQNLPLWHMHYFELKAIEDQQMQQSS